MLTHTLPHMPVETAPVVRPTRNDNLGIVPPWLQPGVPTNTGIVPPYMATKLEAARATKGLGITAGNTGIIPPWMLTSVKAAHTGNDNIGIVPPWMRPAA